MATPVEPHPARPRAPVRNAPDARTLRTTETLLHHAPPTSARQRPEPVATKDPLFRTLQARYG